jgi:hypothetical protein
MGVSLLGTSHYTQGLGDDATGHGAKRLRCATLGFATCEKPSCQLRALPMDWDAARSTGAIYFWPVRPEPE